MGNNPSQEPAENPWAKVALATQDVRSKDGPGLSQDPFVAQVTTSQTNLPANLIGNSLKWEKDMLSFDFVAAENCLLRIEVDDVAKEKAVEFTPGSHQFQRELDLGSHKKVSLNFKGSAPGSVTLLKVTCHVNGERLLITSKQAEVDGKVVELEEVYGISGNKECIVCLSEACDTTFLPCRHMCACKDCANFMMKLSTIERKCPVCRSLISTVVQVNTS